MDLHEINGFLKLVIKRKACVFRDLDIAMRTAQKFFCSFVTGNKHGRIRHFNPL